MTLTEPANRPRRRSAPRVAAGLTLNQERDRHWADQWPRWRDDCIPVFVWDRNDTANQDWSILNRLASRPSAMSDALGKGDGGEVKCSRLRNVGHTPKQN